MTKPNPNTLEIAAAVYGSCYCCGMPAIDLDDGSPRTCEDCQQPICDVALSGCDAGPADQRLCWSCFHERNGEDP